MKILIVGASGFVGKEVAKQLSANNELSLCARHTMQLQHYFPQANIFSCDFLADMTTNDWLQHLTNIDVVINCVGIFYHPKKSTMWKIHFSGPKILYDACVSAKVKKIIHVSALGIDNNPTEYAKSKLAAENYLKSLSISAIILRPSIVYGSDAIGSMSIFRGLAGLPIISLPGKGNQKIQPIAVNDLAKAIVNFVNQNHFYKETFPAVGNTSISIKELILTIRDWLGLKKTITIPIPLMFIYFFSLFGNIFPNSIINTTAYHMMEKDNIVNDEQKKLFISAINFLPKSFQQGLYQWQSTQQDKWHARLFFVKHLLKLTIAFMWIWSGICSAFFSTDENSYQLLQQVGIKENFQSLFLYGASTLNVLLGVALLFNIKNKINYLIQIFIIFIYTLIITIKLPYFWLEPFGSIAKNIPILVAIWIAYCLEE